MPMRRFAFAVVLSFGFINPGAAQDGEWRHATGLTGEPKYPAGFAHFDYVNPDAP